MSEENNKKQKEEEKDVIEKEKEEIKNEEEINKDKPENELGQFSFDDDEKEEKINTNDDDLPEDIKKKLEKKKSEKDSKKSKKGTRKRKKKKIRNKVVSGHVHIKATYNNTIVTFTDENGEVISWASAGVAGFKGPKKSTPYAAQIITKIATIKAKEEFGFKEASVFVKGVGMGRESVIRTLNAQGIFINSIKDITPIPHNGCRPRKPRRV
ncbi:30S ribosomal protein S11 [bacterium]|nr:30S ribosomal protein S11 [bacterium]